MLVARHVAYLPGADLVASATAAPTRPLSQAGEGGGASNIPLMHGKKVRSMGMLLVTTRHVIKPDQTYAARGSVQTEVLSAERLAGPAFLPRKKITFPFSVCEVCPR